MEKKEKLSLTTEWQLANVRRNDGVKLEMHHFATFMAKTKPDRNQQLLERVKGGEWEKE